MGIAWVRCGSVRLYLGCQLLLLSNHAALYYRYFRFVRGVLALMLGYLAFALVILIPVDATGSNSA